MESGLFVPVFPDVVSANQGGDAAFPVTSGGEAPISRDCPWSTIIIDGQAELRSLV